MIYRYPEQLPNYLGVSDIGHRDRVIMARDITTLPAGRTRIDGDKAVVTVSTVTPRPPTRRVPAARQSHYAGDSIDGSELLR